MERNGGLGLAGLGFSGGLWMLSGAALAVAMRHNVDASALGAAHTLRAKGLLAGEHGAALAWSAGFTALQLAAFLAGAFVLRVAWHLRTAVCYTLSGCALIVADAFGLFCLLVWLRVTLGAQ
jgi:hypothetical protein